MLRDMSVSMQGAISSSIFRPIIIAHLDIASDPVSMWTGVGTFAPSGSPDSVLNGKFFNPLEAFAEMSDFKEDDGIGGPVTIRLKGHNLDEISLRQFVRDKRAWRGRKAYVWLGIYNETLNGVLEYPIRIKTGVMTNVNIIRSVGAVGVDMVIDEDFGGSQSAPFHITDHREVYPTDKFTAYIAWLANKPAGLESTDMQTAVQDFLKSLPSIFHR